MLFSYNRHRLLVRTDGVLLQTTSIFLKTDVINEF